MKEKVQDGLILFVFGFVLAAFGGWIYEQICVRVMYGSFMHRGMLDLPLLPIYGFGAWGLALLLRRVRSVIWFFLLSVLIASAFEFACSYLLELIFHESFWTYSDWPLSVCDRISLISSLIFGVLAVFFVKAVLPFVRLLLRKLPRSVLLTAAVLLAALMIGDFLFVNLRK